MSLHITSGYATILVIVLRYQQLKTELDGLAIWQACMQN